MPTTRKLELKKTKNQKPSEEVPGTNSKETQFIMYRAQCSKNAKQTGHGGTIPLSERMKSKNKATFKTVTLKVDFQ
jgi:hypothetical protein